MILGLDISTSVIGVSGIDNNSRTLHKLSYINLKDGKDLFEKAIIFKNEMKNLPLTVSSVAIEEPLVMYKAGFSSAQVLSKLSMFNGMCSIIAMDLFNVVPVYYNVSSARKLAYPDMKFPKGCDRKEIVWKHVDEEFQDIEWFYGPRSGKLVKQCYDMSDACIIALAHHEVLNNKD
jgi:hypothetical protein